MNINAPSENIALPGIKARHVQSKDDIHRHRSIALLRFFPLWVRAHVVALLGEFVGTFMFLFFAFSATQVANYTAPGASVATAPNASNLLFVSLAFGFSLAVNAWIFFRITGGLFNPAVTLGMCLIGAVTWVRGAVIVTAQILGAIASAGVVSALFPGVMAVQTMLNGSTSIVRGLFIEMFLTAELVFAIFMMAAEKHKATFIAPIGIGLALFVAELPGVYYTGGSLNPARSFGPAVVNRDFVGYHWIYWLGPALGSLVAVAFYKLVKMLEYETENPNAADKGADADDVESTAADRLAKLDEVRHSSSSPQASRHNGSAGTGAGAAVAGSNGVAPTQSPLVATGAVDGTAHGRAATTEWPGGPRGGR